MPAADTGSNVCPWLDSGRFQECQKYPRNPSSGPFLAVVCIQQGSRNPKGYPVGLGCNLCHAAVLPHSPVKWKEGQSPESPPPVRTGHVSCPDFSTIDLSPSTFLCLSCILSPTQTSSASGRGGHLCIEEGWLVAAFLPLHLPQLWASHRSSCTPSKHQLFTTLH